MRVRGQHISGVGKRPPMTKDVIEKKYTLEHKICISCIHNSTSGYRFMKTPWGLVNYINCTHYLQSYVYLIRRSNELSTGDFYILIITDSSFFVPFPVAKLSQKHNKAPSWWLTEKESQSTPELKEILPLQHSHSSAVSLHDFKSQSFPLQEWKFPKKETNRASLNCLCTSGH